MNLNFFYDKTVLSQYKNSGFVFKVSCHSVPSRAESDLSRLCADQALQCSKRN